MIAHIITIIVVAVFMSSCESRDIRISLGDRVIPNHGLVTTEDIGNRMNFMAGLECTHPDCCTTTSRTRWHQAHTTYDVQPYVHTRNSGFHQFGVRRPTSGELYLYRNFDDTDSVTSGIWRCTITDNNDQLQTQYIGIYKMNDGRTGSLSAGLPSTIQYSEVNEDPVGFTLTFRTTGGPATVVTWTRDGVDISSLVDRDNYTQSQRVVPDSTNPQLYTDGNYDNILTVRGRLSGEYGVSVTNDRTPTPVTACYTIDDGISIRLGDRVIPNHGMVSLEDIGIDNTGTNLMDGLQCSTTYSGCCINSSSETERVRDGRDPSGVGSWRFAHTMNYVPRQIHQPDFITGITRHGQAVYVFRNKEADNNNVLNGIWRCVIPDSSGVNQTKYIGIYSNLMNSDGSLSAVAGSIQFSLVREDPVEFTLTFRTTGGPATVVNWTRDGVDISSLGDRDHYTQSQTVHSNVHTIGGREEDLFTTGDYSNILTVRGRLSGVYRVSVTNDRTTTPVTANVTVTDPSTIENISLRGDHSEDLASINLFWRLNSGAPLTFTITSYNLTYMVCNYWDDSECGDTQSITGITSTNYNLDDVTIWTIYKFTVLVNEFQLDTDVVLPWTLVSNDHNVTILGVLSPEISSVVELANITSVQVTWNQPEGGLTVDEYVVSYCRLNGTDGQCSSFQDEGNVTINGEVETNNTVTLHLEAYSVYTYTIWAQIGTTYQNETDQNFTITTNLTVPSGAPQNLTIINSTSTSVTISWDSVECIHRNGLITGYLIQYGPVNSTDRLTNFVSVDSNEPDDGERYQHTVTDLQHNVRYTLRVAAVNDAGMGSFSILSESFETERIPKDITTQGLFTVVRESTTPSETIVNTEKTIEQTSTLLPTAIGAVMAILVAAAVIVLIIIFIFLFKRRSKHSHGVSKDNLISLSSASNSYSKTDSQEDDTNKESKNESIKASSFSKSAAPGSQGPSIEEFPTDTTVVIGEDVSFKIVVNGFPQPAIQWYHNSTKIASDYSKEIDDHGNLYLPSCEKFHSGEYKMVARNLSGSMERTLQLSVLTEEEAPPPKDVDLSPIPVMDFGSFVANNHKNNNAGFKDLYEALDKGDNHTTFVGFSAENKKLNRFANMTVYDDNRIVLKPTQAFTGGAQFINACYIDGYNAPKKFIATQGPLPHTLTDFWRLVLQEKVHTIVMVTNLKEGKKEKCHQYWPDSGSTDYGPINVTITDQQILADYTIRSFHVQIADSSDQPLKVTQYHFTAWPDHGVPTYATSILAFHRRIKSQHKPKRGPMLVHCSAGVGRTGTFIAIDGIQEQVEKEKIVDIAGSVNKMRHQRMKMVQTQDQFMFIHDAILETMTCGDTQIDAANVRGALMKMEKVDSSTKKTALQMQFEVLAQVTPNPSQIRCPTALRHPDKNRRKDYLPTENHRVVLKGEFPDYINATNVDGYKQKRAYIIAEGPMESTVRNFWKVVSDRKCGVIVMCSDFVENGEESCYRYWPESGEMKYGEFNVVLLDQEECPGHTIRKLSVKMKKNDPQQVTQFHITNWDVSGQCSNLKSITDVIENVSIAQRRTGNNPILVHCHDTVGRSSMFCAIMSTIERCKTEGVVDVFQVIKALRVQKPGAVLNVEQYHLVFNAVLTYLDSFDTYANFQGV